MTFKSTKFPVILATATWWELLPFHYGNRFRENSLDNAQSLLLYS